MEKFEYIFFFFNSEKKSNVLHFCRACGDTPGAVYSKYIHGNHNMMMIQFDSASYPDMTPGAGFSVKVEAIPSGKSMSSN